MRRWEQGRATIEALLNQDELSRVTPNQTDAQHLLDRAATHLDTATAILDRDRFAAYTLGYDAARQALTSLLWTQGLRPTTRGGHKAVYEAVRAQLDPPMGQVIRPFDRMRQERNEIEYPTPGKPISDHGSASDLDKVRAIIDMARRVLPELPVFQL